MTITHQAISFGIAYDPSNAPSTFGDIEHTVTYTVSLIEYLGIATPITGSFKFKICKRTVEFSEDANFGTPSFDLSSSVTVNLPVLTMISI